jgi:hypothetical protein
VGGLFVLRQFRSLSHHVMKLDENERSKSRHSLDTIQMDLSQDKPATTNCAPERREGEKTTRFTYIIMMSS